MAEYIDKNELDIAFIKKCTGDCGCCSHWNSDSLKYDCNLIHNFPPANVVEREKIDKAIKEIEDLTFYWIEMNPQTVKEQILEILKRNIGENR